MRRIFLAAIVVAACSPSKRGGDGQPDAGTPACREGTTQCEGSTFQTCTNGQLVTTSECPALCDDALGCVDCAPNGATCQDGDVHGCDASGHVGPVTTPCTGSELCSGGICTDACMDAATNRSYVGCEYWAVDLDNALEVVGLQNDINCQLTPGVKNVTMQVCVGGGTVAGQCDPPGNTCPAGFTCQSTAVCVLDAEHSPFAIVVSNNEPRAVNVTLTGPGGQTSTTMVASGAVGIIKPQDPPASIPDQSLDGTMTGKNAYEITSDLPIVAYQFNPLDNVDVFSNDASLLIPRTAFDTTYYVMSWPTLDNRDPAPGTSDFYGYLTVVAWQDGTVIEVTPTAAVEASATMSTIAAGTPTQFTLNAFEVLNLEAAAPTGDLTGSKIVAVDGMQTFGVFGGHEAMAFGQSTPPDGEHTLGPCCADHIEEMMFPTSTWGKDFAIARSSQRDTEPDLLRVMAQKDGTTVTFNPAPFTGTCATLAAGQFCQIEIQKDTEVTASDPVLVGHYLESAIWQDPITGDAVGDGDPSMALAVPVEQFRTDYILPVPMAYDKNFLSISAPASGTVQLDGTTLSMVPFGASSRSARVMVTPGQHHLTCPDTCGVEVYGYSDAVSYLFAGGLDLKQIVLN